MIKDKGVLSFLCNNSNTNSLSSHLVSIYQSFLLYNKAYPSKHAEVLEREIQSHERVKFKENLSRRQFFVLNYVKRITDNKNFNKLGTYKDDFYLIMIIDA